MQAILKTIETKKLVGMCETMSLTENKTYKLFSRFMPHRKEILNALNADTLDLKIYPKDYFMNFNPTTEFIKWAMVEVPDFENVPVGMETFVLQGGKYAVFVHQGSDDGIFQKIFTEWLPNSNCKVDNRPHFDVLGEKTKLNAPDSEHEIWIPLR